MASDRRPTRSEWTGFLHRLRLSMSQENIGTRELGRMIKHSHSSVSEWFAKETLPSSRALMRLPGALNRNAHWLLTGEGSPTPPRS